MGRAPCCDKTKVKRGPWSLEEDNILKNFLEKNGIGGNWIALPQKAGLRRCGKSCRLRWLNYLRPDIKHGGFTEEEDNIILTFYNQIGSRWSVIAANLQGRTDNDVKNHWNTKLKKKLLASQNTSLIITKENNIISSVFKHNNYSRNYYGILDNVSNTFTSYLDTNLTNYSSSDQLPLPPLMEIQKNDATIRVEDGYNVSSWDDSSKMLSSHRPDWNRLRCAAFKGSDKIQSAQVEDGYNLCSLDDDLSKMLSHRPGWNRQKCVTFKGSDAIQSVQVEDGYNLSSLDDSSKMLSSHCPSWNRQRCATFKGSNTIQSVQVEDGYNNLCSLDDDPSKTLSNHPCWNRQNCTTLKGSDTIQSCSLDDDSSKMLSHLCSIRQECTILKRSDTHSSTFLKSSSSINYDLSFGISSSISSSSYYDDILENGFDFQENAMGIDDPNSSYYNNVLEIDPLFKGFEN